MKLRSESGQKLRRKAAEMLGREGEHSEVLFDPRIDFDPAVKIQMLKDIDSEKGGYSAISRNTEYFYALFPDDFNSLQTESNKKNLKHMAEALINTSINGRQMQLENALKFLLLFPGERKLLSIPEHDDRDSNMVPENLFFRKLLFSQPVGDLESAWEYQKQSTLNLRDNGAHPSLFIRRLAQLRLTFPNHDVQALLVPADKHRLHEALVQAANMSPVDYAAMAYWATILSAETVAMTQDGRIQFEMPKKSISSRPQLPDRPAV